MTSFTKTRGIQEAHQLASAGECRSYSLDKESLLDQILVSLVSFLNLFLGQYVYFLVKSGFNQNPDP